MRNSMTRREALRVAAGAGVALALGGSMSIAAEVSEKKKVSMAFIGVGNRGTALLNVLLKQDASVEIPAICDIDEKNLNRALDIVEKALGKRPEGYSKGPEDYRRMLERTDLNSVLMAAPQELHAAMAVAAMKAGKFVGSEVPAICTMEECW